MGDLTNLYGDWPLANKMLHNALQFAGYDVRFEFGLGAHSLRHAGSLFAIALRWLLDPNWMNKERLVMQAKEENMKKKKKEEKEKKDREQKKRKEEEEKKK